MKREGYTLTDFADYYSFSHGKFSSRNGRKINRIIPHHTAGTAWDKNTWMAHLKSSRQMSPTVAILNDGTVFAMVPEEMRPWTTGGFEADGSALTLEVQNSQDGGNWPISDAAYESLVKVCADWCIRYSIDPVYSYRGAGIGMHKDWAATACPGPFLENTIKSGKLEKDIRAKMAEMKGENKPVETPAPAKKTLYRVQVGAFKSEANALKLRQELLQKGFDCFVTVTGGYYKVQLGAFSKKANAEALQATVAKAGYKAIVKEA